jgi:hypothetical protein
MQGLLRKMGAEPESIRSSSFPATNIPGVTSRGSDRSGFELTFELFHDQPEFEGALLDVLRLASAACRHWRLDFRPDRLVEGEADYVPGMWTPTLRWSLSPNET